jgi:F-type H+-transporting ATPase subunit epsilon
MADKIAFDLVSPERLLLSEEADMVTIPGTEGYMGVMAGHAPLISTLKPGVIEVTGGTEGDRRFFVSGGFAEVSPAKLIVLAEESIPLAELTLATLELRIAAAEELLALATAFEIDKALESLDNLKQLRAAL